MAIIQNWKIRSRSDRCAATGEPFEDGDFYVTCIFEDPESDGFLRQDLSTNAWENRPTDEPAPFSFWRAKFEIPEEEDAEPKNQLKKGDAESLLQKMIDDDEPGMEKARYILAAKLEREKRLKQVDTREVDGRKLLIYEHRKTGEVLIVADPNVRLEEVDQIQQEVIAMLDQLASENEAPTAAEASGEDGGEDVGEVEAGEASPS